MHSQTIRTRARSRLPSVALISLTLAACGETDNATERFVIPPGATVGAIAETLAVNGILRRPRLFSLYVRLKGADDDIKAGTYELAQGSGWSESLETLVAGRVVTIAVTVPEGWTLRQIAKRMAPIAGIPVDSAARRLLNPELSNSLAAPGPTLEGYLFPETYRFAPGVRLESIAGILFERYKTAWTAARRAALDSLGMSERELITLASIVQAEARWEEEMPLISAVYHNRLRRRMRLQADPTVQYALGSRRSRLLFADIESVADNPYNTYTHSGLPPGPIGAPGLAAIDAALHPASVRYLYFVARPDGKHEFSRSLVEHNRKIQEIRRARRQTGG